MSKLLANRASAVFATALFIAASWITASSEVRTAPTTLVLNQPAIDSNTIASR
jgi:hypothetical protein